MGRRTAILYVRIDPEVKRELINVVTTKYPKLWGGLSAEVEAILRDYLAVQHTTSHTKGNPGESPTIRYCRMIMDRVRRGGNTRVSQGDLNKIIGVLRGKDPRTTYRWTKALLDYQFLARTDIVEVFAVPSQGGVS